MTRSSQEFIAAYVLHKRLYRDTSIILELLTAKRGKISVIAKGIRHKQSVSRGLLQLFVPILISCTDKHELSILRAVEPNGRPYQLGGKALFRAMYVNELLVRVLHRAEACPQLFTYYEHVLTQLVDGSQTEYPLRLFEKRLLQELGYGLQLMYDSRTNTPLDPKKYYLFSEDYGIIAAESYIPPDRLPAVFLGKHLLAIAHEQWAVPEIGREAKRLMRLALAPLLAGHTIKSRELFMRYESSKEMP